MRNLSFILTSLILESCGNKTNKKNHSIIGSEFQNFKEIERLTNYSKISDTSFFGKNSKPRHGMLHLRNKENNLIIFKSISYDSKNGKRVFKILDTLIISNLNEPELITIGYCWTNEDSAENLISIVEKTDSIKIKNIKKVWKANSRTNKIDFVNNQNGIDCYNEWFSE